MPVFNNARVIDNCKIDGVLKVGNSVRRETFVISSSGPITGVNLYETILFTNSGTVDYTLPICTIDDDGSSCVFINASTGLKKIIVPLGSTIGGTDTVIELQDLHDRISIRYIFANNTWYVV